MASLRWLSLVLALSVACSSSREQPAAPDAADETSADTTTADTATVEDSDDAPLGDADAEPGDTTDDGSVDAALDATADGDAADTATDAAPDTGSDAPLDGGSALPTWPPVCPPNADAGGDAGGDGDTGACTATRVRVVASNLTSGSASNYDDPGIRILRGLHPDVALMQELKYPAGIRALVDTAFGPAFAYVIESEVGAIPNGIVSRYPIVESGEWDDPDVTDRDFVWARIDVPGSLDLFAVSVHLRTSSATARSVEAKNLVAYVRGKVPAGAYLVVGGDLNTAVHGEAALTDLAEIVNVAPPYAVDQAGNPFTSAPRSRPYDWVLPSPALFARMIPVAIGTSAFPAGLVFDTRVYMPLADVAPALSTDSAAVNMQHMAVVRDFAFGD